MPDFLQNKLIGERSLKEILQALERRIARQERKVAKVNTLDELTSDAGDLLAGRFIAQAEGVTTVELSSTDFTGAFMAGSPQPFTVGNFNVGGVKAGALQAGFNTDGEFVAGGGNVRIDADGITLNPSAADDAEKSIKWVDNGVSTSYIIAAQAYTSAAKYGSDLFLYSVYKDDSASITIRVLEATNSEQAPQIKLTRTSSEKTTVIENSAVIINDGGNDFDTRIEGDTDQNLLFIDASADDVGIGTNAPAQKLDVNGNTRSRGYIEHQNILDSSEYFPVNFYRATIADDNATSFTPTENIGILMLYFGNATEGAVTAYYECDASPVLTILSNSGTTVQATTGALTGTTGADNFFTISAASDGKLYFENRRGGSRVIRGRAEGYG